MYYNQINLPLKLYILHTVNRILVKLIYVEHTILFSVTMLAAMSIIEKLRLKFIGTRCISLFKEYRL